MLAIFAVLCGNDYVERSTFTSLLSTFDSTNNNFKFKKLKRNLAGYAKRKVTFYNRILDWLAQFSDTNECLEMILKFVKSEKHELIRNVVEESINEYMCLKPSFTGYYKPLIENKLESKESLIGHKNDAGFENFQNLEIKTFSGNLLSVDILKKFFNCKLSRFWLDILIHRKIIFTCQIEVAHWPSSYLSSRDIRKLFYTLLINAYENKNDLKDSEKPIIIKEYLRYQKEIRIYEHNLNEIDNQFLNLHPSSIDITFILKNLFRFNDQICENFKSEEFLNTSKKLKIFFAILYFWMKSGKDDQEFKELVELKNENFIKAFIVSFLKCTVIDPCYLKIKNFYSKEDKETGIKNDQNSIVFYKSADKSLIDEYFSVSQDLSNDYLSEFKNIEILSDSNNFDHLKEIRHKLNSFSLAVNMSNNLINKSSSSKLEKLLNLKTVHSLCEFQAIYLSLLYVQDFLNLHSNSNEFNLMNLNYFFNSTFLHNFIEELEQRVNPNLYIEELLGRKSVFKYLYHELYDLFNKMFLIETKQNDLHLELDSLCLNETSSLNPVTKKQKKNFKKNLKKKLEKEQKNLNLESQIKN